MVQRCGERSFQSSSLVAPNPGREQFAEYQLTASTYFTFHRTRLSAWFNRRLKTLRNSRELSCRKKMYYSLQRPSVLKLVVPIASKCLTAFPTAAPLISAPGSIVGMNAPSRNRRPRASRTSATCLLSQRKAVRRKTPLRGWVSFVSMDDC